MRASQGITIGLVRVEVMNRMVELAENNDEQPSLALFSLRFVLDFGFMSLRGLLSSSRPLLRLSVSITSTSRSFLKPHTMSFSSLYAKPTTADRDLATLSNYQDIRTTHIDLQWAIDWDAKTIGGQATLTLEATKDVNNVVLDTSYLKIDGVEIGGKPAVSCLPSGGD